MSLKVQPNGMDPAEQIAVIHEDPAAEYEEYEYYTYEEPAPEHAALVQTEPEQEPEQPAEPKPGGMVPPSVILSQLLNTAEAAEKKPKPATGYEEPVKQPIVPSPAAAVAKPPPKPKPKPPPPASKAQAAVPPPAPTVNLADLNAAAQEQYAEGNADDGYEYYEYDEDYVEIEYEVPTEIVQEVNEKKEEHAMEAPVAPPPEGEGGNEVQSVVAEEIEFLSIEDAKKRVGVDKEKYLNDEDFQSVFGITKEEFYKLPGWKQKQKKKGAGFF